jgi:hypothetical protein
MEPDTIFALKQASLAPKLIANLKEPRNIMQLIALCELNPTEDFELMELSLHELIQAGYVKTMDINKRRHYVLA